MKINEYLASVPEDAYDYGPDLQTLLNGKSGVPRDTTAAARLWSEIDRGEADVVVTLLWAQHVARAVVGSVIRSTERDAAPAALKALGFYGRIDPYREAKEYMAFMSDFFAGFDDDSLMPYLTSGQWLKKLHAQGFLLGIPEKVAINNILLWMDELGLKKSR